MGLDVTAYELAAKLDPQPDREKAWEMDDVVYAFVYDGFEQSLRGLDRAAFYLVGGETHSFRAGSYGGYNHWRETLCGLVLGVTPDAVWADPERYRDRPFFELICFASNEGTIGPEACAALAVDFAEYAERFAEAVGPDWTEDGIVPESVRMREKYGNWRIAFELAAGTGMVVLH